MLGVVEPEIVNLLLTDCDQHRIQLLFWAVTRQFQLIETGDSFRERVVLVQFDALNVEMLYFAPLAFEKLEALNGDFCGTGAEMEEVAPHFLVERIDDFPEPNDDIVVWHVTFVSGVFPPIIDVNALFSTKDHLELTRIEYFQVGERNNLVKWRLELLDDRLYTFIAVVLDHEPHKLFLILIIDKFILSVGLQLDLFLLLREWILYFCRERNQVFLTDRIVHNIIQRVINLNRKNKYFDIVIVKIAQVDWPVWQNLVNRPIKVTIQRNFLDERLPNHKPQNLSNLLKYLFVRPVAHNFVGRFISLAQSEHPQVLREGLNDAQIYPFPE